MDGEPRRIVLAANTSWYITNFRGGLVRALRNAGFDPVAVAPVDPPNQAKLAELGLELQPIVIDRSGINPVADWLLLRRLRALFKALGPVAVLGFTIKPNIYGALAASRLGIPFVANVSGLGTAFMKRGLLQGLVVLLYRRAFRSVHRVFFENPDDRQLFLELKIVRSDQSRVVPGAGVDLAGFAPAPAPSGPPTFLLIARLLGDKGIREFVEAARRVRPRVPEARFRLLGSLDEGNRTGIARSELQRWIDEGVIEYAGETADVRPFIAEANAIVLPSYREGLPQSLLEGAAMARPLIASDVPGCRELVDEDVNGFLCEARDAVSLADAMERFALLPAERQAAMGAESRRKVQERFSEKLVVRAYLEALADVRPD